MYYFYGKVNLGHVVCRLYPYLGECVMGGSTVCAIIMHSLHDGYCEGFPLKYGFIIVQVNVLSTCIIIITLIFLADILEIQVILLTDSVYVYLSLIIKI